VLSEMVLASLLALKTPSLFGKYFKYCSDYEQTICLGQIFSLAEVFHVLDLVYGGERSFISSQTRCLCLRLECLRSHFTHMTQPLCNRPSRLRFSTITSKASTTPSGLRPLGLFIINSYNCFRIPN
jgi:hypothetical protein